MYLSYHSICLLDTTVCCTFLMNWFCNVKYVINHDNFSVSIEQRIICYLLVQQIDQACIQRLYRLCTIAWLWSIGVTKIFSIPKDVKSLNSNRFFFMYYLNLGWISLPLFSLSVVNKIILKLIIKKISIIASRQIYLWLLSSQHVQLISSGKRLTILSTYIALSDFQAKDAAGMSLCSRIVAMQTLI